MKENVKATEQIAQFIANTTYADIPRPVLDATRTIILDGVANVLGGSQQPVLEHIRRYVDRLGGRPECTVAASPLRTSAPLAAFANGAAMHVLDYEPQGIPTTHGTSTLLPGILALAEQNGASGRAVVTAFAVGWEVQQRIATAAQPAAESRPFHPPGIYGPPACAAGCAKLLGLAEDKVRMALGIGASRTGGLFANNGTMTKSTHPGNAGRMGVEAALLAADGFTANDSIIEAPRGYVETLFGDDFDWDALLDGLGERWNLQRGFNIKRYPAQIGMQWATECVATLREKNGIRAGDVEWLELEVNSRRAATSNPAPATGLAGKFSFEYCVAVALTQDHVGIDTFSDAVRFSAPVEAALKKVRLKPNPDIPTSTTATWVQARAGLKDGRVLVERCDAYRGSARNPITRDAHLVKVRDCMRRALPEPAMERLIALVDGLEDLKDARVLARALVGE